ncbi:MAG: GMC family oxidoreductase N-terminal domain-containing protein [Actinomycetota bacterium]
MAPRARPPKPVNSVLAALARGALGRSYVPEVPERMLGRIAALPTGQQKQLLNVLRMLDTKRGALLLTGKRIPVSWLSPTAAEAILQRWKVGRLAAQRTLARTITALATTSLYGYPGPDWDRIGYPGPLGPAPDEPKRLEPITVESDEVLRCDVVIVGSGAGGGCVAGRLAGAGLDVVVLEKGGYRNESDFHHFESEASRELYLYGGALATKDLGVQIIAGSTLGGGTVVNYTTSFRTPDYVLRQWAEVSGIEAFVSGEMEESLDEVAERLGVNTDSSAAGKRDALMEEGLKKLGWHVDMMPRAVRGCTQDESCGYCGFGCRVGGKQSTMRTYLEDATNHGARLVVGADVRQVTIADGRATGVDAVANGHRLRVEARAVVAAGGAIETPALLLRSGLRGRVGRNLHLHPGSAAWGVFDEDVRMWEGTTQARYSNELRDVDDGYGPIFETVPVHPGSWAAAMDWRSAEHHRSMMDKYKNISFCAALPRDTSDGRVRIGRDGSPIVEYTLNGDDERRIADAILAAGRVLEAAGAKEIFSPHPDYVSYVPGVPGAHERWAEETRRLGYRKGAASLYSYHQMGSCRMGVDPSSSAVGPDNETHEVANLFVADGSTFPTASGVNPMLSIYGIANRAAKKIAARF